MIRSLSIIFGFLAVGEAVVYLTGVKLPGSIIGMGCLFAALHLGWVKTAWLQQMVDVLMGNLSLFLVPPCVAVMSYLDLVQRDLLSIVTATVVSTFLVMFVTGKVHELMRRFWS
ncbi:CidA/LrgA family protein [Neisseria zalophi]|uniref:CidA/LrgA family protein n=1 Tax=Neisseria zalophi TaxID=640030 RepID=A0A5J6PSJ9_9NEIS|nr:CidA/LrgA family protein [Neisseria zalophi]QEY25701.1 CidA/LrgA family protein [Neisseria zalophi]